MKYDLKAMEFDPYEVNIVYAFKWDETPDGDDYWYDQFENGLTPEGQAKWDAMKQQWNEENGVGEREVGTLAELGVKPGDVVEFVEGYSGLYPEYVGTTSVVDDYGGTERHNDGSQGFSARNEHTWRIVSRASDTPAQRYVVLTDGETIICTREEAKELCLGGVDAVYKLGDKVEVSVKVEFE